MAFNILFKVTVCSTTCAGYQKESIVLHIRGVLGQKQISRTGRCNYISQHLWDVITCQFPWYLLLAQPSWFFDVLLRVIIHLTTGSQSIPYGVCWWPGVYLAPWHLQQSWLCMPIGAYQEKLNILTCVLKLPWWRNVRKKMTYDLPGNRNRFN